MKNRNAYVVAAASGAASASLVGHLSNRKMIKGPGLISTAVLLIASFVAMILVPIVGALGSVYATNRLTRRIGQVGTYGWSGADCLQWAWRNKTAYVTIPFVLAAALCLIWTDAFVVVILLWVPLIGVATWNGIQMRTQLREALANQDLFEEV